MPATEKTWYDLKLMHMVFGLTAFAMLLATLLMFAKDHNRSWKKYQSRSRDIERRVAEWRLDTANSTANQRLQSELTASIAQEQSQPIPDDLFMQFQSQVRSDEERLNGIKEREIGIYDFSKMDANNVELKTLAADAQEKRVEATAAETALHEQRVKIAQLRAELSAAEQAGSPTDDLDASIKAAVEQDAKSRESVAETTEAANRAEAAAKNVRSAILSEMRDILRRAKLREDILASDRKFTSADLDAAKASRGLDIRDGKNEDIIALDQQNIDPIKAKLDELTGLRDDAISNRETLQGILRDITESEDDLLSRLDDSQAEERRLATAIRERTSTFFQKQFPFLGKKWLEMPILNAFNSPLKIDNFWTENLTQPVGNFGQVRRFDRCTTCHRGIDKTMPGSAVDPMFEPEVDLHFTLYTPEVEPQPAVDDEGVKVPVTLESVYGIVLADYGLVDNNDVAIESIAPGSLAANAVLQVPDGHTIEHGLRAGDVVIFANGDDKVLAAADLKQYLLQGLTWGEPVTLTVRRGLPQPYTSHPRLDLFIGSLSPHKLAVVGCTVCHEGGGTATEFKFASHTPNDPAQAKEWAQEHGWFNNHHWIYPMFPKRFAESSCLKCHHDVASLEPSERFPDPPAPKLVEGHKLIQQYGCFGCHEINGYDGPNRRLGPDMRLEPNYYAAAAALKADPNFSSVDAEVQNNVRSLLSNPLDAATRHAISDWLTKDTESETPQLTTASHELLEVLKDIETPGTMRKVGPTLRHLKSKAGEPFLFDWIREPKNFRPSTKMPQFFEQWDHLSGNDLHAAQTYEPIEILGMVKYLLSKSQPMEYLPREEGIDAGSPDQQIARGKQQFEVRGCLACHQHEDFPKATSDFGPNLTGIGDKLSPESGAPNGRSWLYTWIKQPTHYNPRTKMPDLFLDPATDADGNATDPAADIVEYLLSSKRGWTPSPESVAKLTIGNENGAIAPESLDQFVLENLSNAFVKRKAEEYLANGIPKTMAPSLKGAEIELVGEIDVEKKLQYVGRKSIGKYGCYGCHDIPGFENAKPIGTGLADWGRKETSKLAFEHVIEYLHHGHGHGHGHETERGHQGDGHEPGQTHGTAAGLATADLAVPGGHTTEPFDESYYVDQLNSHSREGFLWQKLKEPRSFDYEKTTNKRYDERLRMPLFPFTAAQREAVATYVLGLVAEPPAEEFVYHPSPYSQARNEGRTVIEKYNCNGCHILELDQWDLEYHPGDLEIPPDVTDYAFLKAHLSDRVLEASATTDPARGVLHASIRGMQAIDDETALPIVWDDEGDPIEEGEEYDPSTLLYPFELWQPTAIDGQTHPVGVRQMAVPAATILKRTPGWGGDLTRLLMPTVTALEKKSNPAAKGSEAMAWLPPPLVGQGAKVQPAWMHDFLLDPYPIRPAVFLRMPKFNMSSDEATKIVNFFAARDGMQYPFDYNARQSPAHLATSESEFEHAAGDGKTRFEHAMQIVTDGNYCVKCHLVGEFVPGGSERALAPDLAKVYDRLRPDYVRRWIANPKKVLPYTAMPVNIPFNPNAPHLGGVAQELYPGTSVQQLDGLVDLLMNFPEYSSTQNDVSALVNQPPPAATEGNEGAAGGDTEDEPRDNDKSANGKSVNDDGNASVVRQREVPARAT